MKKRLLILAMIGFHYGNTQTNVLDTSYVNNGDALQKMDLYLPATKNFKTIMYVHEGSLLSGDKRDEPYEKIARKFQQDGIGFISINYRLGKTSSWPSQPDDVCAAFAWIKRNIAKYHGDPDKIFIVGHSSGAKLASIVATDVKYMKKQGYSLKHIAGFICIGTQLKSVFPAVSEDKMADFFKRDQYLRIFGDTSTFADACAMRHINANIPPGLFIIAEKEQINPPILEQTREFIEKAKPFRLKLSYSVIPNRNHISNISKMVEENDPVYMLIKDFILGN